MEYVYAELVRRGRDINTVPKSKMAPTCVLLIISHDIAYDQVPTGYKTKVKEALKKQGYDENGEPLVIAEDTAE
jgi:hypothetical protein